MNIVLLIIAMATAGYLFYALLCPERF
ncbi:K(+)-transporting ATPase subunit F [Vreelandella profundi]